MAGIQKTAAVRAIQMSAAVGVFAGIRSYASSVASHVRTIVALGWRPGTIGFLVWTATHSSEFVSAAAFATFLMRPVGMRDRLADMLEMVFGPLVVWTVLLLGGSTEAAAIAAATTLGLLRPSRASYVQG